MLRQKGELTVKSDDYFTNNESITSEDNNVQINLITVIITTTR